MASTIGIVVDALLRSHQIYMAWITSYIVKKTIKQHQWSFKENLLATSEML
jgi:hypothetical protein